MKREEMLREIELDYVERFERGDAPTLEDLIERYPDLREEIANFVLDFVNLENAAERVEVSEEEMHDASTVQEQSIARALKPIDSFKELRMVAGESFTALARKIHLPVDVIQGLERGMISPETAPTELFERLGKAMGRAPADMRVLLRNRNRQLRAVHWRAEEAPKVNRQQVVSFEEALRASREFSEEYRQDWLPETA